MKQILIAFFLFISLSNAAAFSDDNKRIINGTDVNDLRYPWMVSIVDLNAAFREYTCGGAIVAPNWVITAAHCLERLPCYGPFHENEIEVVIGTYDLNSTPQQRRKVTRIIRHPHYDCNAMDSDIALFELDSDIDLSPLKIAFADPLANQKVTTMGWGTMDPNGGKNFPNILQEIDMNIVADSECSNAYVGYNNVTDNMLCASAEDNGGTCYNDSGGPLVFKLNNEWVLAGITSWGYDSCAVSGYPDVFTRVSKFNNFIYRHIYDFDGDKKISLGDVAYIIRSITMENTEYDLSVPIKFLQTMSGL